MEPGRPKPRIGAELRISATLQRPNQLLPRSWDARMLPEVAQKVFFSNSPRIARNFPLQGRSTAAPAPRISSLLNDRAACPPCHGPLEPSAPAPPSLHHRPPQSSRPRFPSRHRAEVFPLDCRMSRKLSARRLSRICNRPPAETTSPARTPDVLDRPPSPPASPPSLCATNPPVQFALHNRAGARLRRAARRHISPSLFRFSHFSRLASHNRSFRTTPHPSTPDKHFFATQFPYRLLAERESPLPDKPRHTKSPSGCTSSSRCGCCRLSPRGSRTRAFQSNPSARFRPRRYVLPCWDTENPRDSHSRMPRDAAPFPAPRRRSHPRVSDDTRAANRQSELSKSNPEAAAFSYAKCAPADSSAPRGA